MRVFGRKPALVVVATVAMVGLSAAVMASDQALDSAWGCGGACRVAPGYGN